MSAWYETWFNQDYLAVYGHRDVESARREIAFVMEQSGITPESRILDVACGGGRHLQAFLEAEYPHLVGTDLSIDLLRHARESLEVPPPLVRADMRQLPFRGGFDLATLFFTSFGYFDTDAENRQVLGSVCRSLKPNGLLFIDYLNSALIRKSLVPFSRRERGELVIEERRRIDEDRDRLEKEIRLRRGDETRTFHESVRLYSAGDLRAMIREAGLEVQALFGDLDGAEFGEDSPRLYLFASCG